mgnify:CR=1 FL=1
MSLYYEERCQLAAQLRRHIRETLASDPDYAKYLTDLVKVFEDRGYGAIVDACDQEAFDNLIHDATY